MKSTKTRILSLLLAACMLLSVMVPAVFAGDDDGVLNYYFTNSTKIDSLTDTTTIFSPTGPNGETGNAWSFVQCSYTATLHNKGYIQFNFQRANQYGVLKINVPTNGTYNIEYFGPPTGYTQSVTGNVYIVKATGDWNSSLVEEATATLVDSSKVNTVSQPANGTMELEAGDYYLAVKSTAAGKFRMSSLKLTPASSGGSSEQPDAAVAAVEAQISAIGEVTLESEAAIVAARTAYNALTEAQKAMVTKLQTLVDAEAKLAALQKQSEEEKAAADKAAADAVQAKIDAIGKVTIESNAAIHAARAAYNALTATQRALVDIEKLVAAEKAYRQLIIEGGLLDTIVDPEELLKTAIVEFEVGNNDFVATSMVNGHNYLYVPHNSVLLVYDLDTWEKVDEEDIGYAETDGAFVDSQGIVWIYGQATTMFRYDPKTLTGHKTSACYIDGQAGAYLFYPIEVNGKIYVGTRTTNAHLMEYDPATNTFTDLGILVEEDGDRVTDRITTLAYKDGYIYASVHAANAYKLPHMLVKYDLAAKKVVAELDLSAAGIMHAAYLTQTVIVGDVLFGASTIQEKMIAVDINTMKVVDVDCEVGAVHGFSQVIVEEGNEKVYFFRRDTKGNHTFCEYNSSTKKVTPVEGFSMTGDQFNTRGSSFVTIGATAGLSEKAMLIGMRTDGTLVLYDVANKKIGEMKGLTEGDGTGCGIISFYPGPKGSNEIYIGCFMNNTCGVYDITTNTMKKLYQGYSEQIETSGWYDGKWYVSGYGACSVSEMDYDTGKYKVLFALNTGENKLSFVQERIHNIAAGGNKVFATTTPQKGSLGGFIAWYDYEKQTTFVAVESEMNEQTGKYETKVLYQKDSDKTGWYDVKTNEKAVFNTEDNGANDFKGFIPNQVVISLFYIDGYLYGTTTIEGGSGAVPHEDSTAKMFVFDVANMELVTTYDIKDGIEGLADPVMSICVFAPDPEVEGKFWGVVAQTLFTATYDKETKEFQVEEQLSFGKHSYEGYQTRYKNGQMYFYDGYIVVNFRGEDPEKPGSGDSVGNMRIISMEEPSYNFCLSTEKNRSYILGEDGNIYVPTYGVSVMYTSEIIQAIMENKATIDVVRDKIDAIGTVTLQSEAAIKEARAAYNALTIDQKALVTNLTTLTAAEAALASLQENPESGDMTTDTVAAKIGGQSFETVELALAEAAKNGGTVDLQTDVAANTIEVKAGVTLNLNGQTLTATNVKCFMDGIVTDRQDGVGRIKSGNVELKTDNAHLIIGNKTDGYGVYAGSVACTSAQSNKTEGVKFTFGLKGAVKAYAAIATYGLTVTAGLKVDGQDVAVTPVFEERLVKEWAEQGAGYGIWVKVTGLESVQSSLVLTPTIGNLTGAAIPYYTAQ